MSAPDRRAPLDRDHPYLSLRRQCALLGWLGSRRIAALPRAEGSMINCRRVRRLGIVALGPKPRTATLEQPQEG